MHLEGKVFPTHVVITIVGGGSFALAEDLSIGIVVHTGLVEHQFLSQALHKLSDGAEDECLAEILVGIAEPFFPLLYARVGDPAFPALQPADRDTPILATQSYKK